MSGVDDPPAELVKAVLRHHEKMCNVESPKPLPKRAQIISGNEHYRCGLLKRHDGPHRWPGDGSIVEWEDEP